ncbi:MULTISPECIES: RusA family crossover junction endodeoxyribonuclease [Rhizobium]|uniref:RusA family crossover junction endodeoxyribonuclease n=1 Tax=Rhizobium TaxID=379 RepID=UPI0014424B98|nr:MULTISPECIES: RusA family crossover junction endodeoxyribonuclease [Rhizobium]MBY3050557.1 RusA family crossover junction endodeoxyribonuclease [Rhizobium laguerreae]MBY3364173.1 RusA family crossover junction endodeoxyribonuclease [Rhizobium laguerreae]MBY5815099.1 RusA family crossover junction endodeoxyribonuclease [Rhizobium leguminosarum]NKK98830.1 RusA family crossover junction endodeoxyribonuclease [Rhizobium leguminosarum bv. viciae]
MWPDLPFEFNVIGTPVSSQSVLAAARQEWKTRVAEAAARALPEGAWSFDEARLAVTLFYFPQAAMTGDIDNIVKLTLDAMIPSIYLDDSLVDRVLVQRFDPETKAAFSNPSDTLVQALGSEDPILYIRVDAVPEEAVF